MDFSNAVTAAQVLVVRAALVLAVLAAPVTADAQSVRDLTPEQRTFLERLALARARTALAERVRALPIRGDLDVGTWVATDVRRDRGLRLWLRSRTRYADPRLYSDATCEVDVRVDPVELREQLLSLREKFSATESESVSSEALGRAAQNWPMLWATGAAAPADRGSENKPAGWEDVTAEGIQVARRAAEADAIAALLDEAGRLKVTNARRLQDFLESSDAVRTAVLAALEKAATAKTEYAADQVAVSEARLGVNDLLRIVTDAHRNHYKGEDFHTADFREMAIIAERSDLTATGLAAPPARYLKTSPYQLIDLDAPAWVTQTTTAEGRFEPDDENATDEKSGGEAAMLDGVDRLRQDIEKLVLQRDVTVEAWLARHPELKDDVVLFLSGARLVRPPTKGDGDIVTVRLELQLGRLWSILSRAMKTVEVDPPEASTRPASFDAPTSQPAATQPAQATAASRPSPSSQKGKP